MVNEFKKGEQKASIYRAHEATPFSIFVEGTLNGIPLTVTGNGVIPRRGVYEAVLNFSVLPPAFHPSAISAYVVSICCYNIAEMRNGGLNISAMGAKGYSTRRVLKFGKSEQIVIEGDVSLEDIGFTFKGKISGEAKLPQDLAGNSMYIKRIDPSDGGIKLIGTGEGSLFRSNGPEVPVRIETVHTLRPKPLPNPLTFTQFRIVTESGDLIGRTYRTRIHSVVDGVNTMAKVLKM